MEIKRLLSTVFSSLKQFETEVPLAQPVTHIAQVLEVICDTVY